MDYIPFLPTFSRDYYGLELIHNAVVIAESAVRWTQQKLNRVMVVNRNTVNLSYVINFEGGSLRRTRRSAPRPKVGRQHVFHSDHNSRRQTPCCDLV